MEPLSNPQLFSQKLSILRDFSGSNLDVINDSKSFVSFAVQYHSIGLKLHCPNKKLMDDLAQIIPSIWFKDCSDCFDIYLFTPESFGISANLFCDESSQDCFMLEENTFAIQRDFIARVVAQNQVALVCEDSLGDGFHNFLRWFISEKLIEKNKYVLHASCVLDTNRSAHVFLGHSGAGKTTVTRLSAPRLILGDDMNILSFDKNNNLAIEAGAIGGLFNSMIGYDEKVKVKGIYWLNQSHENKLTRLDSLVGSQKVMASFANLGWQDLSPEKERLLLDVALEVHKKVPVYKLDFVKDSSFWKLLE